MAFISYPRPDHNSGTLTNFEHERLVFPSRLDGMFGAPTDTAPVYADGTGVRIVKFRSGLFGWLRGSYWSSGTTETALPALAANTSGQARIDLVVVRLDRSTYECVPHVITGTPAPTPTAPAYSGDWSAAGVYDLPIAEVRVEHNASAITGDKVTTKCWYIGNDGQLRCTATTRPPHQAGRLITEYPSKRLLLSDGSKWMVVGDDAQSSVAVNTGMFAASHNLLHRRNGWVTLQLAVARPGGSLNGGSTYTVGTVPSGFRPATDVPGVGAVPSGGTTFTANVNASGAVILTPGALSIPAGRACVFATLAWPAA